MNRRKQNMDKQYILDLLKSHIGYPVYSFDCRILDYLFTIEDCNAENVKKIEELFNEYIHPNSEIHSGKFHFFIKNIESASLVDKLFEIKNSFGSSTKIQTFKDNTYHEAYYLFEASVNIFYPTESNDYFILNHQNDYYFVCKKNMNTYLLRILREIYFRNNENFGSVVYHAGGFEVNKKGVMVCGDKAKGKTTVILEEIKKGSNYLANDRVILSQNDKNEFFINYLPLSMRIGIGTISSTPDLIKIIDSYSWSRHQSAKVLNYSYTQEQCVDELGSAEKLEMTPKEIHDIFKIDLIESSQLSAIVFPNIDPTFKGMEILPCEPSQAAEIVLKQCMTPIDENWITPWLFQRNKNNDELKKYVYEFTHNLVQNVKAYTIHFGLDAYKNWDLKLF